MSGNVTNVMLTKRRSAMKTRSALLLAGLLALPGCSLTARSAGELASEAVVRVKNAGAVPLRVRVCGDPCTEYAAAAPGASVDLRVDVSRLRRFVVTAMEGDRMVAQEPFTAYGTAISLTVKPPHIERASNDGGIALR